ncbi:MAG: dihydrofolate reductase [Prevotella sp.]|nr:dihydrofolate reductase [Prevotella sp.]
MTEADFSYTGERFADIQLLRYRLNGFEQLSLSQKQYIYCLAKATLYGRDITFDQFGRYNLIIRKTLEAIVSDLTLDERDNGEFDKLIVYLKRVWFSNGIYHHYGCEKFKPEFSEPFFRNILNKVDSRRLPLESGETVEELADKLVRIMFDADYLPKRVNKADGDDLVMTSACNYYEGVTQDEAEDYYNSLKEKAGNNPPSFGLNSKLVKRDGKLTEEVYSANRLYANAIRHIIYWLERARDFAENDKQRDVISTLVDYYRTGDLVTFDEYSIKWVECLEGRVDFINGFIEVYGDPLGLKASWEGIVEYTDLEATKRTRTISDNAQWFEDNSPVDSRFRKPVVKGVTANVICAAMLGGDEYPSTAIGINLPNADWIRAQHGSKSVTIGNLTDAYNKAAKGNGFLEEFAIDQDTVDMIRKYGDICDDLHTDLHECLGHGSGQLLPGVNPDALKAYGNTIEEARADLFGLYYIADRKLVELKLTPDENAYKSQYYSYIMNGLLSQLVRITPGNKIEEAHMRNRALIAHWCLENGNAIALEKRNGKTYVRINDYEALRQQFATLLAEVQRIKSEGDYEAGRKLVETYAVNIDSDIHNEVLQRYKRLNIAPYKGFLNPRMLPVFNAKGEVIDITLDYSEGYAEQMLRYSQQYATLI